MVNGTGLGASPHLVLRFGFPTRWLCETLHLLIKEVGMRWRNCDQGIIPVRCLLSGIKAPV